MWGFGDETDSPREIEALFEELVGPERPRSSGRDFATGSSPKPTWLTSSLAGFDHVRLPFNARGLIDDQGELIADGVAHIDRLIDWCEARGLWVLLDLHGAPGGQTGTNIDDSPDKPELFMDEHYRDLTLRLWRDSTALPRPDVVLGYDLLNEPLPNEWQHIYADELAELYRDLTARSERSIRTTSSCTRGHTGRPTGASSPRSGTRTRCFSSTSTGRRPTPKPRGVPRDPRSAGPPDLHGRGRREHPRVALCRVPPLRIARHRLELLAVEEDRHQHIAGVDCRPRGGMT